MNKKNLERYQIIIYLILIIMIMSVIKVKYGVKEKITNYPPQRAGELRITNTPIPTTSVPTDIKIKPTSPEVSPSIDPLDDYPLWRQLPYYGNGFIIDKYTAPMTLQMTLTTATGQEASKDVKEWLDTYKEIKRQHKVLISN